MGRARRCMKDPIKVHIIHVWHFKINVMRQVKVRSKVTVTFWALGSVRRAAKRSHSLTALDKFPESMLNKYKGHSYKKSRSRSDTKGHSKIKVTNVPCDTCFLGHFAPRYRWWQPFDPITSSNLTFDGGQVKVRSNEVEFSNQYFYIKSMCYVLRIS